MKWQQITHPQQAGPAAHVERENKGKDREHIQEQQVSWFYQGEIAKGSTPPPLLRGGDAFNASHQEMHRVFNKMNQSRKAYPLTELCWAH